MDPRPLNRKTLSKIAGNDPEAIKAFERLFQVAGTVSPEQIEALSVIVVALSGSVDGAALAPQSGLDLNQMAQEAALEARVYAALRADDLRPLEPPPRRKRYGQVQSSVTQVAALANTAYAITFNSQPINGGLVLASGSRMVVDTEGVYDIRARVQLDKTSAGAGTFNLWFAVNGTTVANSASRVVVQGSAGEIFTAAICMLSLAAGDYVEAVWCVDDVSVQIQAFAATAPHPAIPAVILTATSIGG